MYLAITTHTAQFTIQNTSEEMFNVIMAVIVTTTTFAAAVEGREYTNTHWGEPACPRRAEESCGAFSILLKSKQSKTNRLRVTTRLSPES